MISDKVDSSIYKFELLCLKRTIDMSHRLTPYQAVCLQESIDEINRKIQHLQREIELRNEQLQIKENKFEERAQMTNKVILAENVNGDLGNRGCATVASASPNMSEINDNASAENMPNNLSTIFLKIIDRPTTETNLFHMSGTDVITSANKSPVASTAMSTSLITTATISPTPIKNNVTDAAPMISTAAKLKLVGLDEKAEKSPTSMDVSMSATYKLKMPTYKTGDNMEMFIIHYEYFCKTQYIAKDKKAIFLLHALDEITFAVVIRELTENKRDNYLELKEYLLKRFDTVQEQGQRRLLFRQARRKPGQDLQAFYTELLDLAAKAYSGPHTTEQVQIIDDAIKDQLILGCEDENIRLFVLERSPASSRDALTLALKYESIQSYNELIKNNPETTCAPANSFTTISENVHISESLAENNDKFKLRKSYQKKPYLYRNNYIGLHNANVSPSHYGNWKPHTVDTHNKNYHCWQGRKGQKCQMQRDYSTYRKYYGQQKQYNIGYKVKAVRENKNGGVQTNKLTHHNENILCNEKFSGFLAGKIRQNEIMMLCDTESKITLIDENIWQNENNNLFSLEQVDYVQLTTKHAFEILGKTQLNFKLITRRGRWHPFTFSVIVARGLSQHVILGADFFAEQQAYFNSYNNCVYMYQVCVNTVYQMISNTKYNTETKLVISQNKAYETVQKGHLKHLNKDDNQKTTMKTPTALQNKNSLTRQNIKAADVKVHVNDNGTENSPQICAINSVEIKMSDVANINKGNKAENNAINKTNTGELQKKNNENKIVKMGNNGNKSLEFKNKESKLRNEQIVKHEPFVLKSKNEHCVNDIDTINKEFSITHVKLPQKHIVVSPWKLITILWLVLLQIDFTLFNNATPNSDGLINWDNIQRKYVTDWRSLISMEMIKILWTAMQAICINCIIFNSSVIQKVLSDTLSPSVILSKL